MAIVAALPRTAGQPFLICFTTCAAISVRSAHGSTDTERLVPQCGQSYETHLMDVIFAVALIGLIRSVVSGFSHFGHLLMDSLLLMVGLFAQPAYQREGDAT